MEPCPRKCKAGGGTRIGFSLGNGEAAFHSTILFLNCETQPIHVDPLKVGNVQMYNNLPVPWVIRSFATRFLFVCCFCFCLPWLFSNLVVLRVHWMVM